MAVTIGEACPLLRALHVDNVTASFVLAPASVPAEQIGSEITDEMEGIDRATDGSPSADSGFAIAPCR